MTQPEQSSGKFHRNFRSASQPNPEQSYSQSAEKVLRALAQAVIDPGELWWSDLLRWLRPMSVTGLNRAIGQLRRSRLVDVDSTARNANEVVRLTGAGWDEVKRAGFPIESSRT